VTDDGTYTTIHWSYSFDDLVKIARTCMGPSAASKTFEDIEIISLDLVESDLSLSEIQTKGPARRRITMDSGKSWREHHARRLLRHEIRGPAITMVDNGGSTRPCANSLHGSMTTRLTNNGQWRGRPDLQSSVNAIWRLLEQACARNQEHR
jgi:hypothetical protein